MGQSELLIKTTTIFLLRKLFSNIEIACKGKLSTNEVSSERLWWEIFNKIFTILVSCENCINTKDSLSVHLISRYTYEMFVTVAYIFTDKHERQKRLEKFINFNQFTNEERNWSGLTYAEMVNKTPADYKVTFHKQHYRNLSNYAHPTMDSFLLNRRGDKAEFSMILNTVRFTVDTILEITEICIKLGEYFNNDQVLLLRIPNLRAESDQLMKALSTDIRT